MSASVFQ